MKQNSFPSFVFHHIPELIAGFAMIFAITITVANAFSRYFLGFTYAGCDELVVLGFAWCVFPGCAAAFRLRMHMGIDVLVNLFPQKVRIVIDLLLQFLILAINGYMAYLSYYLMTNAWDKIMVATRIPFFFLDMALVVGFAFMTWYSLQFLALDVSAWFSGNVPTDEVAKYAGQGANNT